MQFKLTTIAALAALLPPFTSVQAQTWSECNPMLRDDCPKNPALSGNYEHTYGGEAPGFKATGSGRMVLYEDDGAHFRVEKTNDAPTIASNFYIMYGKLDAVMKVAPGAGIVSSLVFLSDTLDEIDWEWIGSDIGQAQSNYFGKGNTATYDRVAYHPVNHQEYHDYGIEWTPEFVKWSIDGNVVRTLTPNQVKGDFYPQTPMQIKVGSWSGGDPGNDPGTIQWAQGPTDYKKGPFDMIVKSLKVQDYSTGKYYYYSNNSGSAGSIKSEGGRIMVGPSNKPGHPEIGMDDKDEDENKDDDDKPPSFRAPSNSGRFPSSTSTSTATSTPNDDDDADSSESDLTPPGSGSQSGFVTSTRQSNLLATGAPNIDESEGAAVRTLGSSAGLLSALLGFAGLVGVGLVL